jgi:hypothetical protein
MSTGWTHEREPAVSPSTIEPETFGTDDEQAPTVLWIPTAQAMRGEEIPPLALRELEDGQLVMLAYSSEQAFVEGCGAEQPYVTVVAGAIQAFQYAAGAEGVLWDAVLHPMLRQRGELTDDGHPLDTEEGT